jgi:hypothetical protein
MNKNNKTKQLGSVSIFTVIFAALLIMIITMSFVAIMIQDQKQAADADLSQSAYDSAQAGVEDAKRALLLYQNVCESGTDGDCLAFKTSISSDTNSNCNVAMTKLDDISNKVSEDGVKIQTGASSDLNQAYTCVKIDMDTADYLGTLSANDYDLIQLSGVSEFNKVKIEWFNSSDISSQKDFAINLQSDGTVPLLSQTNWPLNRPSILQTQLIQYGSNGFKLDDFNNNFSNTNSNANTLFLYPSGVGLKNYGFIGKDVRKTPTNSPLLVKCSDNLIEGGYACSAILDLPEPIGGGERTAFMYIGALYNNTSFRVSLYKDNNQVDFNGVQPEIDSTGRANDLFRRVKVRVKLADDSFPYPKAAVNISDNLCKNFTVTNEDKGYSNSCTP